VEKKNPQSANENCLYFDVTKQERDSAIRYLLGAIIKCRRDNNFPSNYYTFDEDVNVYLAHLLFAISLPEYHDMADPYLSTDTSDILKWVRGTEDRTIRYFIFKVNADHILMHSAIFDDLAPKGNKFFKKSSKHYRELAQLYYDQAALYHSRIYRKKTGVGEVLEKISKYFDAYQGLLKIVRREYFDFMNHFRDQAFTHFVKEVRSFEDDFKKREKVDSFLDLYAQWRMTHDPDLKIKIEGLVDEIKRVDSGFQFDITRELYGGTDERKCA
jgi:hypothetical protein